VFPSVELESGVHDYDVKLPDVTCYRGRKLTMTNFPLFLTWMRLLRMPFQDNLGGGWGGGGGQGQTTDK